MHTHERHDPLNPDQNSFHPDFLWKEFQNFGLVPASAPIAELIDYTGETSRKENRLMTQSAVSADYGAHSSTRDQGP